MEHNIVNMKSLIIKVSGGGGGQDAHPLSKFWMPSLLIKFKYNNLPLGSLEKYNLTLPPPQFEQSDKMQYFICVFLYVVSMVL